MGDRVAIYPQVKTAPVIGQVMAAFVNWLYARKIGGEFLMATLRSPQSSDYLVGRWMDLYDQLGMDIDETDMIEWPMRAPLWLYDVIEDAIRAKRATPYIVRINSSIVGCQVQFCLEAANPPDPTSSYSRLCCLERIGDIQGSDALNPRNYPFSAMRSWTLPAEHNVKHMARASHMVGTFLGMIYPILQNVFTDWRLQPIHMIMLPVMYTPEMVKISITNLDAEKYCVSNFLEAYGRRGLLEWLWQIVQRDKPLPRNWDLRWMWEHFEEADIRATECRILPDGSFDYWTAGPNMVINHVTPTFWS